MIEQTGKFVISILLRFRAAHTLTFLSMNCQHFMSRGVVSPQSGSSAHF